MQNFDCSATLEGFHCYQKLATPDQSWPSFLLPSATPRGPIGDDVHCDLEPRQATPRASADTPLTANKWRVPWQDWTVPCMFQGIEATDRIP